MASNNISEPSAFHLAEKKEREVRWGRTLVERKQESRSCKRMDSHSHYLRQLLMAMHIKVRFQTLTSLSRAQAPSLAALFQRVDPTHHEQTAPRSSETV